MRRCPEGADRHGPAAAALAAALAVSGAAGAYLDRPPPAHTGGFGEPSCAACHSDGQLDAAGGSLRLVAPATFEAGGELVLEVRLARPGIERAGFALSARYAEGELAGRQAGELEALSQEVRVLAAHEVAYAGHTAAGAELERGGEARWRVRWRAPAAPAGPVVFHVAANAANFDDSEYGDFVYLASAVARPGAR